MWRNSKRTFHNVFTMNQSGLYNGIVKETNYIVIMTLEVFRIIVKENVMRIKMKPTSNFYNLLNGTMNT